MVSRFISHKNLIRGTIVAAGITVIFYLGSVNWSETIPQEHANSTLSVYLLAVIVALAPYGILPSLLERTKPSPIFQVTLFSIAIALPMVCFGFWRLASVQTGGWDYFLVPFWQVIVLMILGGLVTK